MLSDNILGEIDVLAQAQLKLNFCWRIYRRMSGSGSTVLILIRFFKRLDIVALNLFLSTLLYSAGIHHDVLIW
jgi:4-diphosphocytidyl-2C-methyl-D-erythritol kinase